VLSAAVDAESLAPNAETGIIVRIGKCSANNVRKTCVIAGTTDAAITTVPMCGFESNPQYVIVRLRSCAGPTGQVGAPACQLLPSCAAVTVVAFATNTSGTTAAWLVGDGAGAGWPIAVGGDTVGRLGAFGRADGLGVGLAVADVLAVADGLGVAVVLGVGGEDAITAGGDDTAAEDDSAPEGETAGLEAVGLEIAPALLWLLVQAVATRPMIITAPSSAVRLDAVLRWMAATASG
jgi:hypothetical protein